MIPGAAERRTASVNKNNRILKLSYMIVMLSGATIAKLGRKLASQKRGHTVHDQVVPQLYR